MNNIREIERLNQRELDAAIPPSASWHQDWSDTAYVYIGGLPYELSEGDIITIFSQFGEPTHVNLIRDKDTGKSKGFAFLKYEDQRSTTLAVDNLGGAVILGRTIRVDHTRYKPKEGDGTEDGVNAAARDENSERGSRRKSESVERSSAPELLPEEIELQKLIRDHDEDDPMKDWLVREKKKEVENARKKRDMAVSKHRSRENKGKSKPKRKSHKHRSKSRERNHRSRSKDGRHRSRSRDHRERTHRSDRDGEARVKVRERERDGDMRRDLRGRERYEKQPRESERDRGQDGERDRERGKEWDRERDSERERSRRDDVERRGRPSQRGR